MKKPSLFTIDGVEFLELDVPAPRVAWKVRFKGEEFYVCVQVFSWSNGDDILRELASEAKESHACRKAAQAAWGDAIGEEE